MDSFKRLDSCNTIDVDASKKVLVYGYNGDEKLAISNFIKNHGSDSIHVDSKSAANTVSILLGLDSTSPSFDHSASDLPDIKFLMLKGFSPKGIHGFMENLKKLSMKRPVVAALTEHNKNWLFKDLINEVYSEHLQMTGSKPGK